MATRETYSDRIDRLVAEALSEGGLRGDDYVLTVGHPDDPAYNPDAITVHEIRTGRLFAYSAMRADFDQSLREFIGDYIA